MTTRRILEQIVIDTTPVDNTGKPTTTPKTSTTTPKPPVKPPVNTDTNKGGGTDTNKGDTNKGDTNKGDTNKSSGGTAEQRKIAAKALAIANWINVAVDFFESVAPLTDQFDIPEDVVASKIRAYLGGNDVKQCTYVDWIIRLANPMSGSSKFATKYRKQYNYVLTQNGKLSTTLEYLRAVAKHPSFRSLNLLVNPAGTLGDYLGTDDLTDKYGKQIRNSLGNKITFKRDADGNPVSSVFTKAVHAPTMNTVVLALYSTSAYGQPKKQFKI